MRTIINQFAFIWGISGVIALLLYAIVRLSPKVLEMSTYSLSSWQYLALVIFIPYMAYAEGYKGFHKNFAPRVIVRARYLSSETRLHLILLAPLFCMGFIHATRKRLLTSIVLTSGIILLVLAVSRVPQPWRGIIDAGVVVGLGIGVLSIGYFFYELVIKKKPSSVSPDLPQENP